MEDIINQKFGKLTVLSLHESIKNVSYRGSVHVYLCECECGNTTLARRGNLKNGHTASCGCLRGVFHKEKMRVDNDLTGKVFGRLTVLGRDEQTFKKFICICQCGNKTSVTGNHLKKSKTISCGCYKREVSSKTLQEYKQDYRQSLGLDPLTPIGNKEDLERATFKITTQQQILQRDGYSCVWCSTKGVYLHVHHLETWKKAPERRFDPTNLVTLCVECHKTVHNRSYHKDVDPIMTILLQGYSEMVDYNMTEYYEAEKLQAARIELTPN